MSGRNGPVVVRNAAIMGGRPIFRGTRLQIEILFENLADGLGLEEIVDSYPTMDREDAKAALMEACELLKASAVPANRDGASPDDRDAPTDRREA